MYKPLGQLAVATLLGLTLALPVTASAALDTEKQKIGYSLGVMVGRQLQQDVRDLDIDSFSQALKDLYGNSDLKLTDQQIGETLEQLQQALIAEAQQEAERLSTANQERGETFLKDNAKKRGIRTTDSGLQYRVVREGRGDKPQATSTVKVNYEGTLINGDVFDSSYQRGEPVSFRVNQVISGWQEALQLMPVGSEWMLYIPSDLAYGPAGAGGAIGPNETLIFKVELLEITN